MPMWDVEYVLAKLRWMRGRGIWPNGLRYLWTDAFGVVLLVSLYEELGKDVYIDEAQQVVAEVDRVLGRPRGIRIGEEPDRDGQYFHYLAMWLYALAVLAKYVPSFRRKGIELVRQVHDAFVLPGRGVIWKMQEDLSGPYPGYGFGALDAFDGYVSYRMLDEEQLSNEIVQMRELIDEQSDAPCRHAGSRYRHDALDVSFLSRRTVGEGAEETLSCSAGPHVDRGQLFLPRAGAPQRQVRLHKLWRIRRVAGFKGHARTR